MAADAASALSVPRHIKLLTKDALSAEKVKQWFRCVRDLGPSGVVITAPAIDDKGNPQAVSLIDQEMDDGRHAYVVPLARDLSEREITTIVNAFAEANDDLDFDVETSETEIGLPDRTTIPLDLERHLALATAVAKKRHEDWLRERTDAGWRYGTKVSARDKTHPLLRPWDQLPDRYKQPDMQAPQVLVDLLKDQGFVLVDKDDLDRMGAFMRALVQ